MRRAALLAIACLSLATAAGAADSAARPKLEQIIVVYKTHFDIGYTDFAKNIVNTYRSSMIDKTLQNIDANRDRPKEQQFVWTISGWPMEQMLGAGQAPQRKAKIERAIRDGQLAIHALPFSTHTETMEVEDLVRGLHHSSRIARQLGLPLPHGAKTTDVPEHCWLMATVLHRAGVDFMHIGVNSAMTPPKTPLLFWWEGPDGSRLLTMLSDNYGTPRDPPKDWPHATWLAILMTSDNVGPPSADTVKKDVDYWAKKYPGVKVKIGQLSDFYDALKKEGFGEVPVLRGDMPDSWIFGPASSPEGCRTIAAARPLLPATEFLATLNAAWGVKTENPRDALAAAYEQSLLWSEHTWGLATEGHIKLKYEKEGHITRATPTPEKGVKDVEASWQEHNEYARQARKIIEKPCADQLAALAQNVKVDGKRVVVFNSLSWQRDDVVRVTGDWDPADTVTSDDGKPIATEVSGKTLSFIARDVPSMGYRTYRIATATSTWPVPCAVDAAKHAIESPAFRVVFDPARGRIVSLFDKRANRELIDDAAPQGFGYFYQRFSKQDALDYCGTVLKPRATKSYGGAITQFRAGLPDDQKHIDLTPSNMSFEAKVGPLGVTASMSGPLSTAVDQNLKITVTLYSDLPYVDLAVTVDKKGHIDSWPEASWLSLPLKIGQPRFRVGRPGSVVDPATDFIADSSRYYFWTNPGVAVFNGQGGVGVALCDTPLVSLGEPGMMKFMGDYVPTQSRVFVNLHNNVWHTNFVDWFSGRIDAHVRLWSFDRYDNAFGLVEPGIGAKRPLLAAVANDKGSSLPASQAGITLSRPGVLVTAFGPNLDGPGMVLRLWEQAGHSNDCTVRLPADMNVSSVRPIDLRGRPSGEPIKVAGGVFTVPLEAYAPASFAIDQ